MACKDRALLLAAYVLVLLRRKLDRKAITRSLVEPIFTEGRKERAEWEKFVKEVDNIDREYSCRYLWMNLERFEDLFSLEAHFDWKL